MNYYMKLMYLTADCKNVSANDSPSYGCYLSNSTVTYKTFIASKLNLSSSYMYRRLQHLANSLDIAELGKDNTMHG